MKTVSLFSRAVCLGGMLTLVFFLASAGASHAAGYWTCSGGDWITVGQPTYAKPIKVCGSHLDIPHTQEACESAGGKWGRVGLFPKPICRVPTHDGGRPCADVDECEGLCLAALTPQQRDAVVRQHAKLAIMGSCTPHVPVFGCMARVNKGLVTGILCAD